VGGRAVYIARGVLPKSYLVGINDESADCYPDEMPSIQAKQAVSTKEQSQEIGLYPNPNDGSLTLSFPKADVSNILISNMLGMIVHKQSITADSYGLDLGLDLNAGLYHCVLQRNDGTVKTIPFVVK
jgi:hypothetical protein